MKLLRSGLDIAPHHITKLPTGFALAPIPTVRGHDDKVSRCSAIGGASLQSG